MAEIDVASHQMGLMLAENPNWLLMEPMLVDKINY